MDRGSGRSRLVRQKTNSPQSTQRSRREPKEVLGGRLPKYYRNFSPCSPVTLSGEPLATPEALDEQTLVEAAQADPARFLDLYERHFHRVWAYVIRRTANRAEAEDVTSEVFRRALENLRGYEWRGTPFAAWVFCI